MLDFELVEDFLFVVALLFARPLLLVGFFAFVVRLVACFLVLPGFFFRVELPADVFGEDFRVEDVVLDA